jgi:hypothetical protein
MRALLVGLGLVLAYLAGAQYAVDHARYDVNYTRTPAGEVDQLWIQHVWAPVPFLGGAMVRSREEYPKPPVAAP